MERGLEGRTRFTILLEQEYILWIIWEQLDSGGSRGGGGLLGSITTRTFPQGRYSFYFQLTGVVHLF